MAMDGGVMKMRQVDGIDLPAGQPDDAEEPGGYHIMLTGLAKPLQEGAVVSADPQLRQIGDARSERDAVQNIGAMGPGGQAGGQAAAKRAGRAAAT